MTDYFQKPNLVDFMNDRAESARNHWQICRIYTEHIGGALIAFVNMQCMQHVRCKAIFHC